MRSPAIPTGSDMGSPSSNRARTIRPGRSRPVKGWGAYERHGMINYVVPAPELEAFTLRLAHQITANAPLSIAVMKEQLRILAGAHPMTPQGFERVQGLRRVVYDSDDYRE